MSDANRALVRTMPALAVVAPLVIFGFLYVLVIVPAHQTAATAASDVQMARASLVRASAELQNAPVPAVAAPAFEVKTAADLAEAIRTVADSRSIGGVDQLSVQIDGATVTVGFNAPYSQLDEFFSSLDAIGGEYRIRSVDVAQPPGTALAHASVEFVVPVEKGSGAFFAEDATKKAPDPFSGAPAPRPLPLTPYRPSSVEPSGPDPVVRTILFSSQQRSALVDGRIVRPGDRVGGSVVRSIEPDAVVLVTDDGRVKRLALEQSPVQATKR